MIDANRRRLVLAAAGAAVLTSACASLPGRDPLNITVAGIDPLPDSGRGLEARLGVVLRIQNPNEDALSFDGVALELELADRPFATGVSDVRGTVPRYGETTITVPVTVSAMSMLRQALGLTRGGGAGLNAVPYVLRGKLSGTGFLPVRFTERGTLGLDDLR